MKKFIKNVMGSVKVLLILILTMVSIGTLNVFADTAGGARYRTIFVLDENQKAEYLYSSKEDASIIQVDGVTYNSETNTLTLENANLTNLYFQCIEVIVELKGENVIDGNIFVGCSYVTFVGDGSLTIVGNDLEFGSAIHTNGEEVTSALSIAPRVKFDMTGIVTSFKGIGGYDDTYLAEQQGITNYSSLILGDNVKIVEGGEIKTDDIFTFIGYDETTKTNYMDNRVVIKGEENVIIDNPSTSTSGGGGIHTIGSEDVSFTSKDVLDADYSLLVEDKISSLSDEEVSELEKLIKDSHLVLLYNVSVVDGNGDVVPMENGEYVIRLKLSEEDLENYNTFKAIYVNDDGEVEETFDTTIDGEYVEFTTTHLSDYGILGFNSSEIDNPDTGDYIMTIFMMMIISLCGFVVTFNLLRKSYNV